MGVRSRTSGPLSGMFVAEPLIGIARANDAAVTGDVSSNSRAPARVVPSRTSIRRPRSNGASASGDRWSLARAMIASFTPSYSSR